MRYISDDGKVFNTEHECCEYERKMKNERINREKLEIEKQDKIRAINKKYEELQNLISEFNKDYGVRQEPYFAPFYELMEMLYM